MQEIWEERMTRIKRRELYVQKKTCQCGVKTEYYYESQNGYNSLRNESVIEFEENGTVAFLHTYSQANS